jgi:predicted amidohydrolase
MRVCVVQHDIVWENPKENIRRMEARLSAAPRADVYVMAEMWTTGFGVEHFPDSDEALAWMQHKAHELQAALVGSVAVEEEGRRFNRAWFVKPDGEVLHYDKRHLFAPGGEKDGFAAGTGRTVAERVGVRFLRAPGDDLRCPVWSRNHGDYDAAIYVANWPVKRMVAWDTLLRARAIENQCYVIGVNRVGNDPKAEYEGGSVVIDAYGKTMADCEHGAEGFAVADLDMERLQAFRKKFPVLEDRDNYTII